MSSPVVRSSSSTPAKESFLEWFARIATDWSGSSGAFGLAVLVVLAWIATGPYFRYSDTWQLVINTGTTIVTFLMVFLIQRAQNKDSRAVHLKLNELVAAMKGASNRLINAEQFTEEEIKTLHEHYCRLVELALADKKLTQSHSVEEAAERHAWKKTEPWEETKRGKGNLGDRFRPGEQPGENRPPQSNHFIGE